MAKKSEDNLIEEIWVKTIIYSLITLLVLTFIIIGPKTIFDKQTPFYLATSMAITTDDNLLLYDYNVYGNEERFNDGLIDDVEEIRLDFVERNEILAVKVYGENNTIEIRNDIVFITSSETPELNIEYYLIKDMEFNNMNLPCRTFIMLFQDISVLVNTIYLAVFLIVSVGILTRTSIKLSRNLSCLINHYKKESIHTI